MTRQHLLCVLLSLLALTASEELSKPGVNDLCAGFCKKTHPVQANLDACEEGCRVFSMLQFVSGSDEVNGVRERCQTGCVKSFIDSKAQDACKSGCEHQVPFAGGKMEISMDSNDPMFDVAKSAFDGVFDRMSQQMNDNFGRTGSVFGDRDPFQDMQRNMDDMSRRMENLMNRLMGRQSGSASGFDPMEIDDGWDSEGPASLPIERVGGHQDLSFKGPEVGNVNSNGQPILRVEMTPLSASRFDIREQPRPIIFIDQSESDDDANWLACLAARARRLSAMTRWLVCLALFMCVVCMIWICMAIMRTAPRRRLLIHKSDAVMKIATIDSCAAEKQFLAQQEAKTPFIPSVHNTPPPAYDETGSEEKRPLA